MTTSTARNTKPRISFLAFFVIWAQRMGWEIPALHIRVCQWLEWAWLHGGGVLVLMLPRGHAKSTILEVFNAWLYYCNFRLRILHQSEADGTALKTSRGTQNVLRHHPLTRGMMPDRIGTVEQWWVNGAFELSPRNASMFAKGILSNVTSSRADFVQNDDIEVPGNIGTPEAREKLRYRLSEQVHIAVPDAPKLFVGTPHTHDSIYEEKIAAGADALVIRMFVKSHRIAAATEAAHAVGFHPEYVFAGIGPAAALLVEDVDYRYRDGVLTLAVPSGDLIDCYAEAAWPDVFHRAEMLKRRRECLTLNEWDSQYQLHSKPVTQVRLDPSRITPYDCDAVLRVGNGAVSLWLGELRIAGAAFHWDPSSGKVNSDVSAAALVLQDEIGRRYAHRVLTLTGEIMTTDDTGKTITGGQVMQLCDVIEQYQLPRITVETNGIGVFAPAALKTALKQRGLVCGVSECNNTVAKNKRILESLEPLLLSRQQLWASLDVLEGPMFKQMRDWNPSIQVQPDDYVDCIAAACAEMPERIGKIISKVIPSKGGGQWRSPAGGTHEAVFET